VLLQPRSGELNPIDAAKKQANESKSTCLARKGQLEQNITAINAHLDSTVRDTNARPDELRNRSRTQ
jgi:hypothetical protein